MLSVRVHLDSIIILESVVHPASMPAHLRRGRMGKLKPLGAHISTWCPREHSSTDNDVTCMPNTIQHFANYPWPTVRMWLRPCLVYEVSVFTAYRVTRNIPAPTSLTERLVKSVFEPKWTTSYSLFSFPSTTSWSVFSISSGFPVRSSSFLQSTILSCFASHRYTGPVPTLYW